MLNLLSKSDCCGCTACESSCTHSAITLIEDNEGFLYPQIDSTKCIDCGLCEKVCPIANYDKNNRLLNQKLYACHYAKDDYVWKSSSSGGIFTALTEFVINNGGVVVGAFYTEDFIVKHGIAGTHEDCIKFRGSKYSQSDLRGIYSQIKKILLQNRLVLFSGTPCQVEGLKYFLRKTYENLITVDLICHSIPSPKVFRDYVSHLKKKYKSDISSINMKDKTNGWTNQSLRLSLCNGRTYFGEEPTVLWNKLFYSNLILRPSCYNCKFANTKRVGDITIGDYWGIEKVHPDFFDNKGISILMTNTDMGEKVFDSIKGSLKFIRSSIDTALTSDYVYIVKPNAQRKDFWDYYQKHGFESSCNKYFDYGCWNFFKRSVRGKLYCLKHKFLK